MREENPGERLVKLAGEDEEQGVRGCARGRREQGIKYRKYR